MPLHVGQELGQDSAGSTYLCSAWCRLGQSCWSWRVYNGLTCLGSWCWLLAGVPLSLSLFLCSKIAWTSLHSDQVLIGVEDARPLKFSTWKPPPKNHFLHILLVKASPKSSWSQWSVDGRAALLLIGLFTEIGFCGWKLWLGARDPATRMRAAEAPLGSSLSVILLRPGLVIALQARGQQWPRHHARPHLFYPKNFLGSTLQSVPTTTQGARVSQMGI